MCAYTNVLYVLLKAYGLRDLPTAFYPDNKTGGVTLSCYKMHESDSFSNFDDPVMAVNYLVNVTRLLPVHLIFGQKSFFRYALVYYPNLLFSFFFFSYRTDTARNACATRTAHPRTAGHIST